MRRLALTALLAASLAACGTDSTAPALDAGTPAKADAGCPSANRCGRECCESGQVCNPDLDQCEDECVPNCFGRSCGPDLCGGSCGSCGTGTSCNGNTGRCELCRPSCDGRRCGPDGCGGLCGSCGAGESCTSAGQCVASGVDAGPAGQDASAPGPDAAVAGEDAGVPGPDAGPAGLDASVAGPDAGSGVICVPPAPTYNPNFAPDKICDARARVICDRLANCCLLSPSTYAACVSWKTRECDANDLLARIRAGVLTVDMTAARACLAAEASRTACDGNAYNVIIQPCDHEYLYKGQATAGRSCFESQDCVNGQCVRTAGTCGGTCVAYRALGETCDGTTLKCNPTQATCKNPGTGAVCTALAPTNGGCTSSGNCLPTDYCTGDSTTPGTCVARKGPGSPCVTGTECRSDLSCTGGLCHMDYGLPAGAACSATNDCQLDSFCKGKTSTTLGTCTRFYAVGTACTGNECGPDAYCASGFCAARKPVGGSCTSIGNCKPGLRCVSSVCVRQGELGDPCVGHDDCRRYLHCEAGKCSATQLPLASACTQTPQCAQGYCPSSGATANTCTAFTGDGLTCGSDFVCSSQDCEYLASGSRVCKAACSY